MEELNDGRKGFHIDSGEVRNRHIQRLGRLISKEGGGSFLQAGGMGAGRAYNNGG